MKLTTSITYCSLDQRFIIPAILESLKFSDEVIVSMSDHLFDGTPENVGELVEDLKVISASNFHVTVYPHPAKYIKEYGPMMGNNFGRFNAIQEAENLGTYDYILLLDADEIPEGDMVAQYLKDNPPTADCLRFANYWYFRDPENQATTLEESITMVNRDYLMDNQDKLFSRFDRDAYINDNTLRMVKGPEGPMFHHYSWVRSKEDMLKKVKSWGHAHDRDWVSLVEEEFSRPFNGTDFVHGYQYKKVTNKYRV